MSIFALLTWTDYNDEFIIKNIKKCLKFYRVFKNELKIDAPLLTTHLVTKWEKKSLLWFFPSTAGLHRPLGFLGNLSNVVEGL
jgi:hypothetical protein